MTIAALNSTILTLTKLKGSFEYDRTVIDQRRETISKKASFIYTEMLACWRQDDEDNVDTTNTYDFQMEFELAQADLQAQDKALELERNQINTQIEAITTEIEGVEKQLQSNCEKDFKGMGS